MDNRIIKRHMNKYRFTLDGTVLKDIQCLILAYTEKVPNCLVTLDTGLGKTLIALSKINYDRVMNQSKSWIIVCESSSLSQWVSAIKSRTELRCFPVTGRKESCDNFMYNWCFDYDILLLTYEVLKSHDFINTFIKIGGGFEGIIIDEGSHVARFESLNHKVIREMAKFYDKRLILNATPMTISPTEILAQLAILRNREDYYFFKKKFVNAEGKPKNLNELKQFSYPNVFGASRKELNIEDSVIPNRVPVESTADIIKSIKGIINSNPDKRVLIYADKDVLKDEINNKLNIPVMDGRNVQDRDKLQHWFNTTPNSVLVTNILRSSNLSCDIIIFAELTKDWKQFIGRGRRGFDETEPLEVYWLINDDEKFRTIVQDRKVLLTVFNDVNLEAVEI